MSIDTSVEKAMLDGLGPFLILRISLNLLQQLVSLGWSPTILYDLTRFLPCFDFFSATVIERWSHHTRPGIPSDEIPDAKINRPKRGDVSVAEVCLCRRGR